MTQLSHGESSTVTQSMLNRDTEQQVCIQLYLSNLQQGAMASPDVALHRELLQSPIDCFVIVGWGLQRSARTKLPLQRIFMLSLYSKHTACSCRQGQRSSKGSSVALQAHVGGPHIHSNMLFTAPKPCMTVPLMTAGKVSVAVMAAQMLFNSTMWANAFFADMERVETGVECAFQFMAAFAVPAETSDTCALMAYLSRWSGYSMGLIVHLPPEMTPRLLKHISHNVEKLSKASLCLLQCVMVYSNVACCLTNIGQVCAVAGF